ncbi:hypothetical protein [Bradyrhizobium zhanjiangense]|uniref:Hemerythrin-like domain-containing protein n=1 Tax=Bradyrhizobium zhanjiangense TaxID=1325107 RepID=A0ABY0DPQ2_9BRAD|nr:hypothetical protein [Bradyrhizobium zhanjiangense]RXG96356.1 hypothetical protein EAS62_12250 [Bradyrhizobium zhanjiangense]
MGKNEIDTALPDPIFAAIEAHAKATNALLTMHERMFAEIPPRFDINRNMICEMVGADHPVAVALRTVLDTEKKLIDTAPTTQAGLMALEAHLREDRHSHARWSIPSRLSTGPTTTTALKVSIG